MKKLSSAILILTLLVSIFFSGCQENAVQPTSGTICEHTDQNNDGCCDVCSIDVLVNFDFYAINDLHGKFRDTSNQPGVDELSTYLRRAYFAEENVLVFSSGDMWQGSSESNLTQGFIVTEWMNNMEFISMTLGNHEYDWGEDAIIKNSDVIIGSIICNQLPSLRIFLVPPVAHQTEGVSF